MCRGDRAVRCMEGTLCVKWPRILCRPSRLRSHLAIAAVRGPSRLAFNVNLATPKTSTLQHPKTHSPQPDNPLIKPKSADHTAYMSACAHNKTKSIYNEPSMTYRDRPGWSGYPGRSRSRCARQHATYRCPASAHIRTMTIASRRSPCELFTLSFSNFSMSWMTWVCQRGVERLHAFMVACLTLGAADDEKEGRGRLTSTRAFSRSIRWLISRYDRAALYNGSRSGNVLPVSLRPTLLQSSSPEELGRVQDRPDQVYIYPQDEQVADLLHDLAPGHLDVSSGTLSEGHHARRSCPFLRAAWGCPSFARWCY
jgi:hypothetical protein